MSDDWRDVHLGDVLSFSPLRVSPRPGVAYKQVTLGVNGRGARLRRVVDGSALVATAQFKVQSGSLLISKIDARKGAAAVLPTDLDGAVVTGDFPSYEIDVSQVLPPYLDLLVRRPSFARLCDTISAGTTNRVRMDLSRFPTLPVRLPPLNKQHRIVDLMAAFDAQPMASQRLATSAVHLAAVVFDAEAGDFGIVELGSVLHRIDAGRSPMTVGRPPRPGERGVLKVSAVQPGVYVPGESKAVGEDVVLDPRWEVRAGDILMTRANTPERVGAVCHVMASPPNLYLSDKTLRLVPTLDQVDPVFLVIAIGGRRARAQLSAGATGTSASMFNISQEKIRKVRIPLPPLEIQRSIVAEVSAAQSTATAANAVTKAVERLRRSVLQELISGRHEIPSSYDRFFEVAS